MGIPYRHVAFTVLREFSHMFNHSSNSPWVPFTPEQRPSFSQKLSPTKHIHTGNGHKVVQHGGAELV